MNMMGTTVDLLRRSHLRFDNHDIQSRIKKTRGWIFEKGRSVESDFFDPLLKFQSLLPTRVCCIETCHRIQN